MGRATTKQLQYGRRRNVFALLLALSIVFSLSGCGWFSRGSELEGLDEDINPQLAGEPVLYTTTIVVEAMSPAAATPTAGTETANSPSGQSPVPGANEEEPAALDADGIKSRMETNSQLLVLADEAPDSLMGLERRAAQDRETAITLMHSLGFYEGEATVAVKRSSSPVEVTLTLRPGIQYTVGKVEVVYAPEPIVPESFKGRTMQTGWLIKTSIPLPDPSFPRTLRSVKPGDPALADAMLDAVDRLPLVLQNQGYPLAKVASTRYTVNRKSKTLDAQIVVNTGFPATMGEVLIQGPERVKETYLQKQVPWEVGRPWNQALFNRYRETLQQSNLFSVVDLSPALSLVRPGAAPASATEHGQNSPRAMVLPINAELREAAPRTISAELNYGTDTGIGVKGAWEHRNLFGGAEKLRIEVPVSDKLQGIKADFNKPFFFSLNQKLLLGASFQNEKTDAYDTTYTNGYVGVEKTFTRHWRGSVRLFLEDGTIKEEGVKQNYRFTSLQTVLTRDSRNNPVNASRGSVATLTLTPYLGNYGSSFRTIAATLDASAYFRPFDSRKWVLAVRGAVGAMFGSSTGALPASIRYYAGGGGSVRGYSYQAIGPRDSNNDPAGGSSFVLTNLEARYKITDSIGVVAFLDGGAVYQKRTPQWGKDMHWGVGVGFRYYTSIGPVRLDVGFPFTKIKGEDPFQLYISIGQAF